MTRDSRSSGAQFGALLAVVGLVVASNFSFVRLGLTSAAVAVGVKGSRGPLTDFRLSGRDFAGIAGRFATLAKVESATSFGSGIISSPLLGLRDAEPLEPDQTTIELADLLGANIGLFALGSLAGMLANPKQ